MVSTTIIAFLTVVALAHGAAISNESYTRPELSAETQAALATIRANASSIRSELAAAFKNVDRSGNSTAAKLESFLSNLETEVAASDSEDLTAEQKESLVAAIQTVNADVAANATKIDNAVEKVQALVAKYKPELASAIQTLKDNATLIASLVGPALDNVDESSNSTAAKLESFLANLNSEVAASDDLSAEQKENLTAAITKLQTAVSENADAIDAAVEKLRAYLEGAGSAEGQQGNSGFPFGGRLPGNGGSPFGGRQPGSGGSPFGGRQPGNGGSPFGGRQPGNGGSPFGGRQPGNGASPFAGRQPGNFGSGFGGRFNFGK